MLGTLVESRRRRERSLGGTIVSVSTHAALIGAVIAATASGGPPVRQADSRDTTVIYLPPPLEPSDGQVRRTPTAGRTSRMPFVGPVTIPSPAIVPGPEIPIVSESIVFGGTADCACSGDSSVVSASSGDPGGGSTPMLGWMVDVPAWPRAGNPAPTYPRMLRDSGVEGVVLAQFVIDTTGRAEPATFRALDASHALFEMAVREAVGKMRFRPAESAGRKVRVVVQQSFAFRLRR